MASFIGDLRQSQQQAQDADAYRALIRQMEDDSLAKNAVAKSRAEYDNAHMGYGLTRADVAKAMGRPTSEVSMDTLGDAELQQLGAAKMMNQRAALEAMASYNQPKEQMPLSAEARANQVAMTQAGRVLNQGNPGLAAMAVNGYSQDGLSDRDAMMMAQQNAIKERAYLRDLEAMRNSKVNNGKIDPSYWDAAQRSSEYELAQRYGR